MIKARMNEGSAKIYQFPAGGRTALGGRRCGETSCARICRVDRQPGRLQRQLVPRCRHPGISAERDHWCQL